MVQLCLKKRLRTLAMQWNVPADLEALINKRLSSGGYTSPEDVLRRALEAQDAEESRTDEETARALEPYRKRLFTGRTLRARRRRTGSARHSDHEA
jgi:hypothetical protein